MSEEVSKRSLSREVDRRRHGRCRNSLPGSMHGGQSALKELTGIEFGNSGTLESKGHLNGEQSLQWMALCTIKPGSASTRRSIPGCHSRRDTKGQTGTGMEELSAL